MSRRMNFESVPRRRATGRAAFTCAAAVSAVLAGALIPTPRAEAQTIETSRRVQFDIAAQPLVTALQRYSEQAKVQVTAPSELVRQIQVPALQGEYDVVQALHRILDGAGLSFEFINEGAVAIRMRSDDSRSPSMQTISATWENVEENARASSLKVAQATDTSNVAEAERADTTSRIQLEEVIVTGSHIRGAQNLSSPVISFDREYIERTGYSTTQQFIQSLSQSFNNISDSTFTTANGGPTFYTYEGSGINLRGLGGDATLVLINGRRVAAAGRGEFTDISLIPLSAVERVEVLTEGASAIYGSDAVGGVVNLILRRDFEGAEARVRYGTVTHGSHDEVQAGQLLGHSWDSGHAMLSYEYYRRSDLDSSERDFFEPGEYRSLKLIPEQNRHGAFAVASQRLSDNAEVSGEAFYSQRKSRSAYDPGLPLDLLSDVRQYGGSVSLNVDLTSAWQIRLSGLLNENASVQRYLNEGAPLFAYDNESRLWSADVALDGSVTSMPGGDMRLAVGSQFRSEQFIEAYEVYPWRFKRDIAAAYAELLVPLVGSRNRRAGVERLDLSMAGRFEDYSDFGSTFNPKLGLSWEPFPGLNVRGTWGTSFKAPLPSQMNPSDLWVYVYHDYFANDVGASTVMTVGGSGLNLGPEESENWTAGIDLVLERLPGLNLSLTYFDIDYTDRVRSPVPGGYVIFDVMLDPVYTPIVTQNPDTSHVAALLSQPLLSCYHPGYVPCSDIPPADQIDAIVDTRLSNLASVSQSGMDISASYRWSDGFGSWMVELSGTKLFDVTEQLVHGGPTFSQLNDVWRPVDLRLRSSVAVNRGPMSLSVSANYTDKYPDKRSASSAGPNQRATVASWTTADVTFGYKFMDMLRGSRVTAAELVLTAVNLFDKDPPFIGSTSGMYFDGANANPLGRFVGAQVVVRW